MASKRFMILSVIATALFCAASQSAEAKSNRVRLAGRLAPAGGQSLASGKAKFEARGTRLKFSAEGEDLRNVTRVIVFRGNEQLGTAAVDGFGSFDLNLDTNNHQAVPVMSAGDRILVFDAGTNTLVLSGTLR